MIQITVNGVFAETNYRSHVFRSFCRTFVIVPVGSGWSIFSDMLFVTVASDELILVIIVFFELKLGFFIYIYFKL